jgi:hypothetical protein
LVVTRDTHESSMTISALAKVGAGDALKLTTRQTSS